MKQWQIDTPRKVQGVGNGTQEAKYALSLPASIVDTDGTHHEAVFDSPCLEGSNVPGLMGIKSRKRNDALIRCKTGEMWFLGKGGVKIEPSPGSKHFQMKQSNGGHWLLPINRFSNKPVHSGIVLATTDESDLPEHSSSDQPDQSGTGSGIAYDIQEGGSSGSTQPNIE